MGFFALIAGGTVAGLAATAFVGYLTGKGRRAFRWTALTGIAAWLVLSVAAEIRDCPDDAECTPGLASFVLFFPLVGWLAGSALGAVLTGLWRRPTPRGASAP